jgi:hypothetical protein
MKPGQRAAPKPAAPAAKPAAPPPSDDTTRRAKEQESALYKARQDAEARAQAERDRLRVEMEGKARTEAEAKIRAETEIKLREEAESKAKTEAEAKAKLARDAALRMAAEAKAKAEAQAQAKIDAERKLREEVERKAKEEAEQARREADELRQRLEEERKAREAEERKRKDEEERRRKEEAERQMRAEVEAKAREAAEAARREEEDRNIREKEQQASRVREEEDERTRKAREEEEQLRALRAIEQEVAQAKALESTRTQQPTLPAAAKGGDGGSLDALMADLDSFSQREEQERQTRESAERKTRDERKRKSQDESERRAKEQAAYQKREDDERRRKEEEERRAQEEAERRVHEAEEHRRLEAEERKRRARELAAPRQSQASAAAAAPETPLPDDIGVTAKDLDMDDVKRDEAAISKDSRKAQREREREARQREREARERAQAQAAAREPVEIKPSRPRRKMKWGRPVAITLFVLLVAGVGVLHLMPLPMADYEQAASSALGRPVKISSGRLSLFTGVRLNLDGVSIGDSIRIARVQAYPEIGSLFDDRKAFSRIMLEGVTIEQQALGDTLFAKAKGDNFSVGRIFVKELKLPGPVPLPVFEADAMLGADGALRRVRLAGPESLTVNLTPAKDGQVEFDVTASSLSVPFAPEVSFNSFAMKGTATRQGMSIPSWGGSLLDGAFTGTANVRWSAGWQVDGVLTVRGINAAVFAPALLSEGKAEATGRFSMSGTDPAKLGNAARIEGNFTVGKGVLGSFDLSRVIQSAGRQFAGRTQFTELAGQGVYDRGAVALRNVALSAGALGAGASADVAPSGALSGRIVAEIRTAGQSLRSTLLIGGTLKEPQVRN